MKFKFPQIPMPLFYKLGSILFSVSAVGSAINMKIKWIDLNLGGRISMISSFFFQILILTLFLGLYYATKNQPKVVKNPELDAFLQELKEDDEKVMKGGIKKDGKKNVIKD